MNDAEMLAFLRAEFPEGGIARATVTKGADKTTILFHASRPGIVIGRAGAKILALKEKLEAKLGNTVHLDLHEIRRPELEPLLAADHALMNLLRGVALERVLDMPLKHAMRAGALGARIRISGAMGDHESHAGDFSESNSSTASVSGSTDKGTVTVDVALTLKISEPAAL
jgi:small subunit ribosomal protein S3